MSKHTQSLLDDFVGERASPSLKLSESSLVNEFADRLEVRVAPGDVRVSDPQHAQRCLVQLHESGVVDLTKTEQLEDLRVDGLKRFRYLKEKKIQKGGGGRKKKKKFHRKGKTQRKEKTEVVTRQEKNRRMRKSK